MLTPRRPPSPVAIVRSRRVRRMLKHGRQRLRRRPDDAATLLIVGCQRSGTSLLLRLFDESPDSAVFGEQSILFSEAPGNRRLRPLDEVGRILGRQRAGLRVIKPLVESHRTIELLEQFDPATAVWLYRDHRDVAASNLRHFGESNGHTDIAPIIADELSNWRAAGLAAETRERLRAVAADPLSDADAAAMFWWARNSILFDAGIHEDPRVAVCRYASLVRSPDHVVDALYRHAGLPTARALKGEVRASSVGRGRDVELREDVAGLCAQMLDRLDSVATIVA